MPDRVQAHILSLTSVDLTVPLHYLFPTSNQFFYLSKTNLEAKTKTYCAKKKYSLLKGQQDYKAPYLHVRCEQGVRCIGHYVRHPAHHRCQDAPDPLQFVVNKVDRIVLGPVLELVPCCLYGVMYLLVWKVFQRRVRKRVKFYCWTHDCDSTVHVQSYCIIQFFFAYNKCINCAFRTFAKLINNNDVKSANTFDSLLTLFATLSASNKVSAGLTIPGFSSRFISINNLFVNDN